MHFISRELPFSSRPCATNWQLPSTIGKSTSVFLNFPLKQTDQVSQPEIQIVIPNNWSWSLERKIAYLGDLFKAFPKKGSNDIYLIRYTFFMATSKLHDIENTTQGKPIGAINGHLNTERHGHSKYFNDSTPNSRQSRYSNNIRSLFICSLASRLSAWVDKRRCLIAWIHKDICNRDRIHNHEFYKRSHPI